MHFVTKPGGSFTKYSVTSRYVCFQEGCRYYVLRDFLSFSHEWSKWSPEGSDKGDMASSIAEHISMTPPNDKFWVGLSSAQ
jgi:hypothetical protein